MELKHDLEPMVLMRVHASLFKEIEMDRSLRRRVQSPERERRGMGCPGYSWLLGMLVTAHIPVYSLWSRHVPGHHLTTARKGTS